MITLWTAVALVFTGAIIFYVGVRAGTHRYRVIVERDPATVLNDLGKTVVGSAICEMLDASKVIQEAK